MIEAISLTKMYGTKKGVENISFKVDRGEIVGFLGPNGAGKTTTMRLLTGFLYPNDGDAYIEGNSIIEKPLIARKYIGYLSENNPLYEDLKVKEYLDFRGRVKGLKGKELKSRIDYVVERCEIKDVISKLTGSCSKGYRQRIGIADALINDPPILILDEPTQGLDPAQIYHTRELIKSLSVEHTVILSTHILSEVEAICSRVLLIQKGNLIFDGSLEEMKNAFKKNQVLDVTFLCDETKGREILSSIKKIDKFEEVKNEGEKGSSFLVYSLEGEDIREEIFWKCFEERIPLLQLNEKKKSLEEAFLKIISEEPKEEEVQ
jgi:ABC-2 type transport system ATP-binding protein